MCPVCLTDRWPSTHTGTHVRSHKIRNALTKLHASTRTHRVTQHLTSHESHMKGMGKVMHSPSYMQTHAPTHRITHTRIHGHSHRSQSSLAARTLVVSHIFPFTIMNMLMQITHTEGL